MTIAGTEYRKGVILLCHFEYDMPQFGLLEAIITENSGVYFALRMMETDAYMSHWNSYCVNDTLPSKWFFAQPSELPDHSPLHLYHPCSGPKSGLKLYIIICMKYDVCDTAS